MTRTQNPLLDMTNGELQAFGQDAFYRASICLSDDPWPGDLDRHGPWALLTPHALKGALSDLRRFDREVSRRLRACGTPRG